jgi:uncharacterized protein (TIGR01568 family)
MRWGLRSIGQQPREAAQHPQRDQEQQNSKGKSKAVFPSFSPLAWLSKLRARNSGAADAMADQAKPASAKGTPQAAIHNGLSTIPLSMSKSSPAGSSSSATTAAGTAQRNGSADAAVAADIAPRRLSVGNDDTQTDAAAARHLYRRRHYSVGGDRDLLPLGHLISLSRSTSPKPPSLSPLLSKPDTEEEDENRPRSHQRRRRPRRAGARRSFSSGNAPPGTRVAAAVRVRSPRLGAAAVSELERFAVVRRTRDPQREFRASMVEMIASKRMVGRPDELEALLACYLSLNADEHHDCIVKVFRQVWFELKNSARAAAAVPSPRS